MKPWEGILNIPEGQCGNFALKHFYRDPGNMIRCNRRGLFHRLPRYSPVYFPQRTRWHELSEKDQGIWMTDLPIEQTQMDDLIKGMRGKVLVGGLGLGYAATVLARRKSVSKVVVVEQSEDVIQLIQPHLDDPDNKIQVVHCDLFKFIDIAPERFHWALYDIWQSDGEYTFFKTVLPLRQQTIAHRLVANDAHIRCWNETVMRGQLLWALQTRINSVVHFHQITWEQARTPLSDDKDRAVFHNWTVPFFVTLRDKSDALSFDEATMRLCQYYTKIYGITNWEAYWQQYCASSL